MLSREPAARRQREVAEANQRLPRVRPSASASSADAGIASCPSARPTSVAERTSGRSAPDRAAGGQRAAPALDRLARQHSVRHQVDECGRLPHRAGQVGDRAAAQRADQPPLAFGAPENAADRRGAFSAALREGAVPGGALVAVRHRGVAGDASLAASGHRAAVPGLGDGLRERGDPVLQRGARLRLQHVGGLGRRGIRRARRGLEREEALAQRAGFSDRTPRGTPPCPARARRRARPARARRGCLTLAGASPVAVAERRAPRRAPGGGATRRKYRRFQFLPLLNAFVRAFLLSGTPSSAPSPPPAAGEAWWRDGFVTSPRSPEKARAEWDSIDRRTEARAPPGPRRTLPRTRATLRRDPRMQCSFGRVRARGGVVECERGSEAAGGRGFSHEMLTEEAGTVEINVFCAAGSPVAELRTEATPVHSGGTRRRCPWKTSAGSRRGTPGKPTRRSRWTPTRSPAVVNPVAGFTPPERRHEARAARRFARCEPADEEGAPVRALHLHLDAVASRRGDPSREARRSSSAAAPGRRAAPRRGPGAAAAGGRGPPPRRRSFHRLKKSPRLAVSRGGGGGGGGPRTYRRGRRAVLRGAPPLVGPLVSANTSATRTRWVCPPREPVTRFESPEHYFDVQRAVAAEEARAALARASARFFFF